MSAVLATPPFIAFYDNNGDPLSGGLIYTYAAGTTTPQATYTDSTATVTQTNPIVLDSAGRAVWFINGSYKYVIKDSLGNTIETVDNVTSFTTLAASADAFFQSFSGNGSQTAFTLSESLGTDPKALMVFVDSGLQTNISNGNFATDTVWTKGAGWTIAAGVATAAGAISTAISQTATATLVAGQAYAVSYTITRSAGGLIPSIGGTNGVERTASGTYKEIIIAGSSQTIAWTGNAFTGTLDDVSVTIADSAGFNIIAPTAYTVSGTALTFTTAPASGTNNIYVFSPSSLVGAASAAAALAQTYATAALASQNAAATSASNAATSETNAAASAASALSNKNITDTNVTTTNNNVTTTNNNVTTSGTNATNASNSAAAAAASAVLAGSTFNTTSVSSNTIGTGAKTFTVAANKNFVVGVPIIAVDSGNAANYIQGTVTSYSSTTLVINGLYTGGSGTIASWNISVCGIKGTDGGGAGTVTSVSVTTANGVSGSVATATTTPAITLTLGAITPTTVTASSTVQGTQLISTVATGTAPLSVASTTVVPNLKAATANAINSSTTSVDTSAATAPSSGQVLTATSSTAATWQTPSSGLSAASQAQMETATSNAVAATPGTTQYHPGVAKAWVMFNGTGTVAIRASYNVSSITDNGTGDYTVNFTTAFSSANYGVSGCAQEVSNNPTTVSISSAANPTASACRINVQDDVSGLVDSAYVSVTFFGDQ